MVHDCVSCSLADVWFEVDGSNVYLNFNRLATASDLELNHYLECEGQVIETLKVRVAFCPFCGQKLTAAKQVVEPMFEHYSFGSGE